MLFQVENRALRLREVATAMQLYQDDVLPSTFPIQFTSSGIRQSQSSSQIRNVPVSGISVATADKTLTQQQTSNVLSRRASTGENHGDAFDISSLTSITSRQRFAAHRNRKGLRALLPEEISSTGANSGILGGAQSVGDWEYFNEGVYIRGGSLRNGEDPYIRNRFNQEASDAMPSNREIPDTRHPM